MAIRSGHNALDKVIEDFLTLPGYASFGGEISQLKDTKFATNRCGDLSDEFGGFAEDAGLEVVDGYGSVADTDMWGYKDRKVRGCAGHVVTELIMEGETFMVDFTAAQYGYHEFPMVQKKTDKGWVRQWQGAVMPACESPKANVFQLMWRKAFPQKDWRKEEPKMSAKDLAQVDKFVCDLLGIR